MMTTDDRQLDALFAEARAIVPEVSDALFDRVLADAGAVRPPVGTAAAPRRAGRLGGVRFWPALAALFGGGGVLAGLGSAMVVGVALGLLQPAPVSALTTALFDGSAVEVDLMPTYEAMLEEMSADE